MADTTVDLATTTLPNARNALWWPYWISPLQGVIAFLDSWGDPAVRYTLDWWVSRTKLVLKAGTWAQMACFFDREIPWCYWTNLHVAYADNNGVGTWILSYLKRSFASVWTTEISNIATGLTWNGTSANNKVTIGITRNYNIILWYVAGASSTDTYKRTWGVGARSVITNVFEWSTNTDIAHIYPAWATGDDADAACLFRDVSEDEISVKMYDDSANTRTETSIRATTPESHAVVRNIDWAIRRSDWHLLIAFMNDMDVATADLMTYDLTLDSIATPTITNKTNVFSNASEAVQPSILINQLNNNVYVCILKNGTWLTSESVVYYLSTDGMATRWGETAYSETARNYRITHAGRSISPTWGRVLFCAIEFTAFDIWINLVNDIQIEGRWITLQ